MPDILHRVGFKSSSPSDAYKALATIEGLSAWWTDDTQGESKVGGVIKFRFGRNRERRPLSKRHSDRQLALKPHRPRAGQFDRLTRLLEQS